MKRDRGLRGPYLKDAINGARTSTRSRGATVVGDDWKRPDQVLRLRRRCLMPRAEQARSRSTREGPAGHGVASHFPQSATRQTPTRGTKPRFAQTGATSLWQHGSLIRLAASVVIEQNNEWLVGRRYLSNHSLEAVLDQQEEENNDREEARELTAA